MLERLRHRRRGWRKRRQERYSHGRRGHAGERRDHKLGIGAGRGASRDVRRDRWWKWREGFHRESEA